MNLIKLKGGWPLSGVTALIFSPYLGGTVFNQGFGLALDSVRRVQMAGFPLINQLPPKNPVREAAAPGSATSALVTELTQSNGITGALTLLLRQPLSIGTPRRRRL